MCGSASLPAVIRQEKFSLPLPMMNFYFFSACSAFRLTWMLNKSYWLPFGSAIFPRVFFLFFSHWHRFDASSLPPLSSEVLLLRGPKPHSTNHYISSVVLTLNFRQKIGGNRLNL